MSFKRFIVYAVLAAGLCLILAGCPTTDATGDTTTDTTADTTTDTTTTTVTVEAPVISVSASGCTSTVTIACATSGATIYYTTDGTAASTSAGMYTAPITLYGYGLPKTISAMAALSGTVSESSSKALTVGTPLSLSGTVSVLAGSGTYEYVNGTGTGASFQFPLHICSDGTNLFETEYGSAVVRKIVISTAEVTTLAGSGSFGTADGESTDASFLYTTGITTDGTNLYVADNDANTIRKVAISTGYVSTLAGSSSSSSTTDGTGAGASFNGPWGVTTDGANLYVAEYDGCTIRKVVISTGVVTTLAGSGNNTEADGTGTAASFCNPKDLTTDGTNLYVVDKGGCTVRKVVIATGETTTLAGSSTATGHGDGKGSAATFTSPRGIVYDGAKLYVTDDTCVRVIDVSSAEVTTLAASGKSFTELWGIASDGSRLYAADGGACLIDKIQ